MTYGLQNRYSPHLPAGRSGREPVLPDSVLGVPEPPVAVLTPETEPPVCRECRSLLGCVTGPVCYGTSGFGTARSAWILTTAGFSPGHVAVSSI